MWKLFTNGNIVGIIGCLRGLRDTVIVNRGCEIFCFCFVLFIARAVTGHEVAICCDGEEGRFVVGPWRSMVMQPRRCTRTCTRACSIIFASRVFHAEVTTAGHGMAWQGETSRACVWVDYWLRVMDVANETRMYCTADPALARAFSGRALAFERICMQTRLSRGSRTRDFGGGMVGG